MTYGTVHPTTIGARLLAAFGYVKATPKPGELYRASQPITLGPISFPGWQQYEGGAGRDEQRARVAVTSAWVFSDIQAIGNELAVSELKVKERTGEDLAEAPNHELERLWEAPNPFMGKGFLMRFWTWQLLLYGKAFIFWSPGVGGVPAELWPVPALFLRPVPHPQKFIDGYVFKASPAAPPVRIDAKFITYTRLPHPFDIHDGLSPLAAIYDAVESDLAMRNWNKMFFSKENAAPTGLITVPRETLDSDLARIRIEMADFFGGATGRRVGVARAGDMDWKPFDRSQKEMEFLEGRRFSRSEIDRAFGFPEGYWSADATRANSEGAKATMIENACYPHLVALQEDMNAQNIPAFYGDDTRVEFEDIRPRNRALELQEFQAYQAVETVDELRERIGKEEIGDPRGKMLVAEIAKGTPIPATPASDETEAAISAMEQEAGVGEAPDEPAPAAEEVPALPDDGAPPVDGAPTDADSLMDRLDATAKADDLRRWQIKAIKALKAGRGALVPFSPDVLTEDETEAIKAALADATDADAVRAAFKAAPTVDAVWAGAVEWAKKAMDGD